MLIIIEESAIADVANPVTSERVGATRDYTQHRIKASSGLQVGSASFFLCLLSSLSRLKSLSD